MGGIVDSVFGGGDDAADASRDAGRAAADASIKAAEIQAESQREALDYLKEREQLPSQFTEAALTGLGGEFGLRLDRNGNVVSDGMSVIDRAKSSPFYNTSIRDAEDAVLRNASATGGLRSGTASENLARANNMVLENEYNRQLTGLQGLSRLPSNANNIASTMAGIGQAQGAGIFNAGQAQSQSIIGAAQSQQAGNQQGINNLLGIASFAAPFFSDNRLKENLQRIGTKNGFGWYRWQWNEKAQALGLSGEAEGYMASEVAAKKPEAVGEKDGFATIDYQMLEVA